MNIGDRLRALREAKNFTQGEIEKRTGLLRTYVSRVENGHAIPSVVTLEKFARALEVPTYQLFYDGEEPPALPNIPKRKTADDTAWGNTGKDARWLYKFCRLLAHTEESDRKILMVMTQEMRGGRPFDPNCIEAGRSVRVFDVQPSQWSVRRVIQVHTRRAHLRRASVNHPV
jgi:transcriptional regulator with XRE-family HTH domain